MKELFLAYEMYKEDFKARKYTDRYLLVRFHQLVGMLMLMKASGMMQQEEYDNEFIELQEVKEEISNRNGVSKYGSK